MFIKKENVYDRPDVSQLGRYTPRLISVCVRSVSRTSHCISQVLAIGQIHPETLFPFTLIVIPLKAQSAASPVSFLLGFMLIQPADLLLLNCSKFP